MTLVRQSSEPIAGELVVYLNRLSDLLFVMARAVNRRAGQAGRSLAKADRSRQGLPLRALRLRWISIAASAGA